MKKKITIIMGMIYLILLTSKKTGLFLPELLNSYLSDLICIPLVLSIARYGVAYWFNNALFKLNSTYMVSTVLVFIFLFELVLPHYSPVYTSDPADALMYIYGGVAYWWYQTEKLTPSAFIQRHSNQC